MKRYRLPVFFALITLSLTLAYTRSLGWRALPERKLDIYPGYAASLVRGEGYRNCPVEGYMLCEGIHGMPAGDSQTTAYRLPIYPLWLAAQMAVFGETNFPALRLINCLLAAALVSLTVGYAERCTVQSDYSRSGRRGGRAGLAAGMVMLANPQLIENASVLMSEMLFALLIILLFFTLSQRTGGIVGAFALLTRGTLLLSLPLLVWFIPRKRWRSFGVGLLVIMLPWIGRNAIELHGFIPFSTGSGHVLYGANNPYAADGWWHWAITFPDWSRFAGLDEVTQDRALTNAALSHLRTLTSSQIVERVLLKWNVLLAGWGLLLPLVFIGLIIRRRFDRPVRICLAFWAGLLLNTAVFWGDARFVFPIWSTVAIATACIVSEE